MKLDVTPVKPNLPKIYKNVKRFLSKLGLEYKMVDCCGKRPCSYMKINSVHKMARCRECKFFNASKYCVHRYIVNHKQK